MKVGFKTKFIKNIHSGILVSRDGHGEYENIKFFLQLPINEELIVYTNKDPNLGTNLSSRNDFLRYLENKYSFIAGIE